MSDRGTPGVEGPPACPFIAFEDERDERSSSPDHRHRCFAEVTPAPRALAHQEAYCLSSAFPVCPTFQDWARREAAQARSSGRPAAVPPTAALAVDAPEDDRRDDRPPASSEPEAATDGDPGAEIEDDDDPWATPRHEAETPAQRNPPRDWAAPPPWATGGAAGSTSGGGSGSGSAGSGRGSGGSGGSTASGGSGERAPDFLASRSASAGLVGSSADRLASGQPVSASPSSSPSDDLAGLVAPAAAGAALSGGSSPPPLTRPPSGAYPTTTASGRRPTVSSTRPRGKTPDHDGPSWESAKRYEAYPTIKTRAGLPGIPRILIWVAALGIAALALFFLPDLVDFGGGGAAPSASPSSSTRPTAEPTATPIPEPTAQTYTIKKGDTLNKIAKKFDVTIDQLLEANKKTIKNADRIKVGQEIVIPVPIPDEFTDPDAAEPSADDEATPEP